MNKERKRKMLIVTVVLLIIINFLFFLIGYENFMNPKLGNFEVKYLKEDNNKLKVEVTPSHNATEYLVSVYKQDTKIYEAQSPNYQIELEDFTAEFNDKLDIEVIAKNKNGEEKKSENKFIYLYKDSTFEKERDHYLSGTRDFTLFVLGYDDTKNYTVELFYKDTKIYDAPVESENIVIPYNVVEGYSGRITAILKNDKNRITSSFNFYLNTPIVGKISIQNPQSGFQDRWNDITLDVDGGKNANHYFINLLEGGFLVRREEVKRVGNKIKIPADFFEEEKDYEILLEAVYEDYVEIAEKSSIAVHIGKKETTWGVYTTHNPTFIKQGTKVELKTITENAVIHYTTDGSDPTKESPVYKEALSIDSNMTVKAFAESSNRHDSVIRTFNFEVREKKPVIYLSPSNQDENYGVESVGYTTEMEIMNRVADVVEEELKNAGFIVYRNNPRLGIDEWVVESKRLNSDFHFAIHSNASARRTARGPEIHVDNEYSLSYSIASNIYENLWSIYDGNSNYDYHRGIKFTRGGLGEASDHYLECSSLIEIAFHDEVNDAAWVMNNISKIGKNIASSIISYYN